MKTIEFPKVSITCLSLPVVGHVTPGLHSSSSLRPASFSQTSISVWTGMVEFLPGDGQTVCPIFCPLKGVQSKHSPYFDFLGILHVKKFFLRLILLHDSRSVHLAFIFTLPSRGDSRQNHVLKIIGVMGNPQHKPSSGSQEILVRLKL